MVYGYKTFHSLGSVGKVWNELSSLEYSIPANHDEL